MSEPTSNPLDGSTATDAEGEDRQGPVIRDRRRLDPQTGKVRDAYLGAEPEDAAGADAPPAAGTPVAAPETTGESAVPVGETATEPLGETGGAADVAAAQALAAERLEDLQRLQAEFVNYRRRVERDRDVARDQAVAGVLEALLPVLDDLHLARQHGDLEGGPFAAIAEKLEATLTRFGLARYGEPGEAFDPTVHEALIHTQAELAAGTTQTTVVQILQPGYRSKERVLRAARVAVADPS
jgi:molecular chaperone GrpE